MNPWEYENLARIENQHWFYVGKRQIVRNWIQRTHPLRPEHLLVDCGAGTGVFAAEMKSRCHVLAIDDHDESLSIARTRLKENEVRKGSCAELPVESASADVLTALDVLEHVKNDQSALIEFGRVTRPGGIIVITVPAFMCLWSDWDVSLKHFRRYSKNSLLALVPESIFDVIHCNYINVLALPFVWLIRRLRPVARACNLAKKERLEDVVPVRCVNEGLRLTFVALGCQRYIKFPAGVGLLLVLRRKEEPAELDPL
jgi:2-polyprenyl-3-methyl-5-hydroxy-6-metoxy-1,4-benzoquinol methylase